jgi:hypothetical protein
MSALGQKPCLVGIEWWTTRGKHQQDGHSVFYGLLQKIYAAFGTQGLHVFDRGYANDRMVG